MSTLLISLGSDFHFSPFYLWLTKVFPSLFDFRAVRILPGIIFWPLIAILALFAVYFFKQGYQYFVRARAIQDHPTAKIRSAAQGYVELEGEQRCLPQLPIIAPLSQQRCTWYRYSIQRYSQKRWVVIKQGYSSTPFLLDDGTGTCVIEPANADVTTPLYECWLGFRPYPHGQPKTLLSRLFSMMGNYRYHEWRMQEGMPLYAAGNFETVHQDNKAVNLLRKTKLGNRQPFILSARSEKKIIRSYKWAACGWFSAYLILMAFIILLVTNRDV